MGRHRQAARNPRRVYRREDRVQVGTTDRSSRERNNNWWKACSQVTTSPSAPSTRGSDDRSTRSACGCSGTREAAEELTQDVFLTAWRKAARFDATRGRLSTWLMTIAHNLAVDRLRRETGVTRPTLVLVDEVPERAGVDEGAVVLERDAASARSSRCRTPSGDSSRGRTSVV